MGSKYQYFVLVDIKITNFLMPQSVIIGNSTPHENFLIQQSVIIGNNTPHTVGAISGDENKNYLIIQAFANSTTFCD